MSDDENNTYLIPDGRYRAVAIPMENEEGKRTFAQLGWTGNSDTRKPQLVLYFQIIEGLEAGWRAPWFGFLGKDSYERTMRSLRYAGMKGDNFLALTEPGGKLDQIVEIDVQRDTYNNKTRSKIQWINDPNGGRAMKLKAPMTVDEARQLSARLKSHWNRIPETTGDVIDRTKPLPRPQVYQEEAETATAPAAGNGQSGGAMTQPPRDEIPPESPYSGPDDEIPFARCDVADVDSVRRLRWP